MREAAIITAAASLLGFAYSFVMEKGLFFPASRRIATPQHVVPPEFISLEEALALFKSGDALFVDARHAYDFNLGHIPGAVNVPLKDFVLDSSPLAGAQMDKLLVTYCDGANCNSSIELANKLSAAGFTRVKMFFGGWNEWKQHHLQTDH